MKRQTRENNVYGSYQARIANAEEKHHNKPKFDLAAELRAITTMPKEALEARMLKLEEDLVLLDTQLDCHESGIDVRTDLWYKQATYVYYGKRVLLRKIANKLAVASDSYTSFLMVCNANNIPTQYRESNTRKCIIIPAAEVSVTLVFNNQGEFINVM